MVQENRPGARVPSSGSLALPANAMVWPASEKLPGAGMSIATEGLRLPTTIRRGGALSTELVSIC